MFSARDLRHSLDACSPREVVGYVVALSGGFDSCALLAAASELWGARRIPGLRAVHVDHGLHAAAAEFRESARAVCVRFEVPLTIVSVAVSIERGRSLEEAARQARYEALAAQLAPGECLLTAHHSEDQAETFLLQALRGAGLRGLSGMPERRTLGAGWHLRPLLGVSRTALRAYGAAHGVAATEDPMNEDERFDRVYLRRALWPGLERRWPAAAVVLSRSCAHAAQASATIDELASTDLAAMRDGASLSVPLLRRLPPARRIAVLREFIRESGARQPSARRLHEAHHQLLDARPQRSPVIAWGSFTLRRYRDRVELCAGAPTRPLPRRWDWHGGAIELGESCGRLRCVERLGGLDPARLPAVLDVGPGRCGELLQTEMHAHPRPVRELCRQWRVLPWMRPTLPFIRAAGALVAIADLWQEVRCRVDPDRVGVAFLWDDAPRLF